MAVALGAGLLAGCQQPQAQRAASGGLRLGAAEVDITPPVGFRMAGYFDERISTGIHDPLKAKALVLQQGREQVALVFCDLLGLSLHVTTNARAMASQKFGIPVSHIMICATHSHTGPLFDDIRRTYYHQQAIEVYGFDPHETLDYPTFLIHRLVQVIGKAQLQLRPADLAVGKVKQEGLTFNRRYWMKNGKVVFNPGRLNPNIVRPAGPTDPEVGMLMACEPSDGKPFAGMTRFSMHSDTVGGTLFSADYEYYVQQTLRRAYGPEFISAFGLGTCGDLNHIDVKHKEAYTGFAQAEHLGTTLGQAVTNAVAKGLRRLTRPALAVRSATYVAKFQEVSPEQRAQALAMADRLADSRIPFLTRVAAVKTLDLASRSPTVRMEVQVFQLDADTAIVCLPGEIFAALGLQIKRESPFRTTFVLSVCNDRPSYVPTRQAFIEGSYEVNNARVQPGTGEALVRTALELLHELKQ